MSDKVYCKRFDKTIDLIDCFDCDYLIQVNYSHNYIECGDNELRYWNEIFKNRKPITELEPL